MTTVSVLVAVGPDAPYLSNALASLESQTFRDFEVLQLRQKGIHNAWNEGAKDAKGDLLAILDSDDEARPERLKREVCAMFADESLALVGSWGVYFGDRVGLIKKPEKVTAANLLLRNQIIHSSVMMRKDIVKPFGPYRDRPWIDYDLWCRMAARGLKMRNIPEPLVRRREHGANDSRGRPMTRVIHGELSARMRLLWD